MIDSLLYAKLPPHLKRSLNLAYLENGTYDQIVAQLERELELSGLQIDGELTKPTTTALLPNENQQNTEQIKVTCHYCKKPGHVIRDCRKKMRKEQEQRNDPLKQNIKPSTSKSFSPCLIANGQTILQKNVAVVSIPLIDPNGSNRSIQQTIEMMGKNKET